MIGRERELRALTAHVAAGGRLVTVFGPGGIGKTTLARALLRNNPSAVFVPLSSADDVDQAAALVARALEVSGSTEAEIRDRVKRRLTAGVLLVLDNTEHLPAAAEMLHEWTEHAPRACIVTTSRARLGLPYEDVVELGPLARSESVELFVHRAAIEDASASARAAIERIVSALDGVPLAIELAAARARDVPLSALAAGSHDLHFLTGESRSGPARHRSIDDLVEWSWALLDAPQREAMIELSAYRGGMSFELAEQHGGQLSHLRDRGLVAVSDGRYRLLEIVRAFVEARADTHAARLRHAQVFVDEAVRRGALLPSLRARDWLQSEIENLGAAASFARSVPALALRAALAVDAALTVSHLPRPPELLDAALADDAPPIDRARALARLATARWKRGGVDTALAREAWELALRCDDLEVQAFAANALLVHLGSSGAGLEGAEIVRRFTEPMEGLDPFVQGLLRASAGYALPARELVDAYPRWLSDIRDPSERTRALYMFAAVLAQVGQHERALAVLPEHPDAEFSRGWVLLSAERFTEAARAWERATDVAQQAGFEREMQWASFLAALARAAVSEEGAAEVDARVDEFLALGPDAPVALIAAALVRSKRARALLEVARAGMARYALELEAFDAIENGERDLAARLADTLEARIAEMPPSDGLDSLLIHRIVRLRLREPTQRILTVGPSVAWFRLDNADPVGLAAQELPRRILEALLRGQHDADALFAAAWPSERASRASAHTRVRVTLARLRKLGLETAIVRDAAGWRIARDIEVVHSSIEDPRDA